MRRKVTAITLACFFALAGASYAAPTVLPGGNDQPGNSDCKGNHQPPGANGLCR
jgi:hypothetical protein